MAISSLQQLELKHNPPPPTSEVIRAALDYMERTGMTAEDFAHECDYAPVTFRKFFAGTYRSIAQNDAPVRRAITRYMDAHPLAGGDEEIPERLFPSKETKLLLARLLQAQEEALFAIFEGPPGTSKTTTLKWFWADHNKRRVHDVFYVELIPGVAPVDMLCELCRVTGAYASGSRYRLFNNCVRKLRAAPHALLLIDECQYLIDHGVEPLEIVRKIVDRAHCGCILAGHFNFVRNIQNGLGRVVEPFKSRIHLVEHLRGLERQELQVVAKEYFGEALPGDVLQQLASFATFKDQNAGHRKRIFPETEIQFRYLNFRRVRNFLKQMDRLRAIPANASAPLADLARAAMKTLLAPQRKAL